MDEKLSQRAVKPTTNQPIGLSEQVQHKVNGFRRNDFTFSFLPPFLMKVNA